MDPRVESWDDVASWLRERRERTGRPTYAELARRVQGLRIADGDVAATLPGRTTVYDCFREGRRRMDVDLVATLGRALGLAGAEARSWAAEIFAVQNRIESARIVSVTEQVHQTPYFVGRTVELEQLLAHPVAPRLMVGMAGAGKTQLALRAAQALLHDGRIDRILVADLRGHHPTRPPADAEAMLDELVRLLTGALAPRLSSVERRRDLLTEALIAQRCLLLLDDAADVHQLEVLTPLPRATLLVTSRNRLDATGLEDQHVGVLSHEESLTLMRLHVGTPVVDRDPDSAGAVVEQVGRLPLAVDVTSRRIASMPDWSLSDHREALAQQAARLQLPGQVEATLDLSLRSVAAPARSLLRVFADQPCRSLDLAALAALDDSDAATVAGLLDDLARVHLAQRDGDRMTVHDLVRVRVLAETADHESPSARAAARRRLLEHVLRAAQEAVTATGLTPMVGRADFEPAAPPHRTPPDPAGATAWLLGERENLLVLAQEAHSRELPETVLRLSATLSRFLDVSGLFADGAILHELAAGHARHCGDRAGDARSSALLGSSLVRLGEDAAGVARLEHALDLVDAHSDPDTFVNALNALAVVAVQTGDYPAALARLQEALAAVETGRTVRTAAPLLGNIAVVQLRLGDLDGAAHHHEQALRSSDDQGDRATALVALSNLSEVHLLRGDLSAAESVAREALARGPEPVMEAAARTNLAQALVARGRLDEARTEQGTALELARSTGDQHLEASVLNDLGDTELASLDASAAGAVFTRAGALATQLSDTLQVARHHGGLALAAELEGDRTRAHAEATAAAELFGETSSPAASRVQALLARLAPPAGEPV